MMMNKTAQELVTEIKKIRGDQDKIQAYLKTCAEQITVIAQNTAPADSEPAVEAGT